MACSGAIELAVPGSGEVERAVAGSGEMELVAAGSGEGQRAVAGYGEGKRALLHSLDYPCTKRLRLRRLLAYYGRYNDEAVYKTMTRWTRLIFHVRDLMKLVKTGQWGVASSYVTRFVYSDSMSDEATFLVLFLQELKALNEFAEGITVMACVVSKWFLSIYKESALAEYPCFATLVADVLFLRSDHARAFLNWRLVRNKAAEMVEEMVYKTPELKDRLHFPRGLNNLYNVVRIGSSFRRRCHVKIVCRKQSTDYAQFYLQMRKRLPSSIQGASPDYSAAGSERIMWEQLIVLLERALQAGGPAVLEQGYTCEYSSNEDFPLVQMLSRPPFLSNYLSSGYQSSEVHRPEHSSKGTSQSPAVVASPETNSAMKRLSFQESHQDTPHPGNDSKRPRTTGNFGEDPSPSFKAHLTLVMN